MERNDPALADYAAFLAVVEAGSFRAAAERLDQSPSALSRRIAALERGLGTRLLDRHTRRVAITPQGEVFARVAARTLDAARAGLDELRSYLASGQGRLAIAGLPSVTAGLLPPLVERFAERHPDVDLRILDGLSDRVLDAVEGGEADLGFTAGTPTARDRLAFSPLLADEFRAVGRRDGPLRRRRAYAWAEVAAMPFVAMAPGTSVRELVDAACARAGEALEPRFEVSHLATAGALVAQGLGVTALPTLTFGMIGAEGLVFRAIEDFGGTRRIGLVWRAGVTLSPPAKAFLDLAREGSVVARRMRALGGLARGA